jgi:predicted amidohydrolase
MNKVRVAAAQLGVGTDLAENLATCRRMIDRAVAEAGPDLVVLPEFCNHLAWYDSPAHAYEVSLDLDGEWLAGIAGKAGEHGIYVKLCVTARRENGLATVTNILYGPDGQRLGVTDKQTLMGNENNFFARAREHGPILDLPIGRVGMYACADGLLMETSRLLAVRGAQVLLNSLNSFALDEASLHIPVRAAENRCFVVAACKVGPLLPPEMMEAVAQRMGISSAWLHGAGESQIVAPDGTVLAIAPRAGEAVVWADIEPAQADDKRRPDGTDVFQNRRPKLYQPIAQKPPERHYQAGAARVQVACYQPQAEGEEAVRECAEAVTKAAAEGAKLVVLPELFCFGDNEGFHGRQRSERAMYAENALSIALMGAPGCVVATSLPRRDDGKWCNAGVLVTRDGVVFEQPQLHRSERHAKWCKSWGNALHTIKLPFGRLAIIVGDDALYPETFRLAALQDVEIVAAPMQVAEKWELELGLPERAAENRLSIVAASRPSAHGGSAIITVTEDFTLWSEWKNRPFDGHISYPLVTRAKENGLLRGEIYPACAGNRFVSQKTDLVDGRPWWLCGPLVAENSEQ